MSWETALTYTLHFNRKTYETRWQVEEDLEEVKKRIEYFRQQLYGLALMTEPQKMLHPEDKSADYMDVIRCRVSQLLEQYEEDIVERSELQTLLCEWDNCHTTEGKPITPPDDMGDAYIWGDFIRGIDDHEDE